MLGARSRSWVEARFGSCASQGAIFLDVHAAERDEATRSAIEAHGQRLGLAQPVQQWRAWLYDSEADAWGYLLCNSEAEAQAEVEEAECDAGPEGHPAVEAVIAWIGTPLLAARMRMVSLKGRPAFDLLALAWVEDTQPMLDGAWWRDAYDPAGLSAPRAGILPTKVPTWAARICDPVDDDEFEEQLNPWTPN